MFLTYTGVLAEEGPDCYNTEVDFLLSLAALLLANSLSTLWDMAWSLQRAGHPKTPVRHYHQNEWMV